MKNALKVAKWEFGGTIKNRQFIILTTLFPLIILGATAITILIEPEIKKGISTFDPDLIKGLSPDAQYVKLLVQQGLAGLFAGIFLFVVIFSGTFVLQNIVREKQSRVVEILLSAITPRDLINGKILAFGALGLVQALIWVVVGLLALLLIGPYLGLQIWSLLAFLLAYMPWDKLLLFSIYFVLGYLFIASFSAGMGATMTDVLSGQQVQSLFIALPSALPLMIFTIIISYPDAFVPVLLSYIPPTIAGTMMLRIAATDVSILEIIGSLVVLLISTGIVMRLAGKVFEVGILMYGKSATIKEIWRWMRG